MSEKDRGGTGGIWWGRRGGAITSRKPVVSKSSLMFSGGNDGSREMPVGDNEWYT